jgi:hypothetical protein
VRAHRSQNVFEQFTSALSVEHLADWPAFADERVEHPGKAGSLHGRGDTYGPWQEIATTADGTALWTSSRVGHHQQLGTALMIGVGLVETKHTMPAGHNTKVRVVLTR